MFSLAPLMLIFRPFPFLRFSGTSIFNSPLRYFPVKLFGFFITSSGVPAAIICPPYSPAPGPTSTRKSDANIVSVSCSTTINELPKSRISFNELINLSLSFWWSPILGSSRTYKTPDNFEPIWVASLILCASPPDKVPALLVKVKYDKPTLFKNSSLEIISFNIRLLISFSSLFSFNFLTKSSKSLIDISHISKIFLSLMYIDNTDFCNLFPLQTGHSVSIIYPWSHSLIHPLFVSTYLLSSVGITPS